MTEPTDLEKILQASRDGALTPREYGTVFEELTARYLEREPAYADLYAQVQTWTEWAKARELDARDVGIDLVAETRDGEYHAVQCKNYEVTHRVQKKDIDSFFTASGKSYAGDGFARRLIVTTTDDWSEHAESALEGQKIPVTKIDKRGLEESLVDWSQFQPGELPALKARKALRPHQKDALGQVLSGLEERERGKLIMACGSGKTFTSLKIAEARAGAGKRVLFMVPSLSLLSQTLTEWSQESEVPLHNYAVCSDSDVGKKRRKTDDLVQTYLHELRYPATTKAVRLAEQLEARHDMDHMSVVYATYHSVEVLAEAQGDHGLAPFDLVICDEAHRTTGAKFAGQDESAFIKVHDNDRIKAERRLYMTATPRIYAPAAKAKAESESVTLCSMDDEALYGPQLYVLTFSEAVNRGLLVDYKVIVLAVEAKHVDARIQSLLKDDNNQLRVDDAAKIIGCYKALGKIGLDEGPAMRRAVAFCQVIEPSRAQKTHKVSSKEISSMFQSVVEAYQESEDDEDATLRCEAEHVDGSMNASQKDAKLTWLKEGGSDNTCRVLSNVRCLSEGVDVPALDAVLFLTPRNSQVDVVQSVGRVMRRAPGKERGYVVLPVVIPFGMEPSDALNDNQTYKVVWQVLNALRSHDDRFDAMVNKLEFNGSDSTKMEVIAVADKVPMRNKRSKSEKARGAARGGASIGTAVKRVPEQRELEFEIGELERAIYAKLVKKVGNRHHWEEWATDIAKIAQTHIGRIEAILADPANAKERKSFGDFVEELRDDLNEGVTETEVVEMLAQHLVTKPVFEALFEGHAFTQQNSMSRAMDEVLKVLEGHRLDKEAATLERFYESVKLRASGIDSAQGKQKIIVELYDKFFRNAFPQMSDRLGIVYTPVEIVDFILYSVNDLLEQEFGQTLGSEGVHIIDPFTGTGSFVTRLLESGLIAPEELPRKYAAEIHANEIVLLAYYIASINIEATYHGLAGGEYEPFEGICLTDTFQMYEKEDLISRVLVDNSARRKRQKGLDIRVILGNPPYSVGQGSQNDNNQNVAYPSLDARIGRTYGARSSAKSSRSLYDSYIRAIRWASDRLGESGIIGFVTNANFVEANTADGLRRSLAEEFSSLYVFHLRGNQRTSGERSRKEGGKVFGQGSRAPVAISLLVKNPSDKTRGRILFRDVGDYLSRDEKLVAVSDFSSVAGITAENGWTAIEPDEHGDWLRQRDMNFELLLPAGIKDRAERSARLFGTFSLGVATSRDAWAYGASRSAVARQMASMIDFYNAESARFDATHDGMDAAARRARVSDFIDADPIKISWSDGLKADLVRGTKLEFDEASIVQSVYRPFTRQWLYFHRKLNDRVYQLPNLFPEPGVRNRVIGVSGIGARKGFSCLMVDGIPCLDVMEKAQFFPLYTYETSGAEPDAPLAQVGLFESEVAEKGGEARGFYTRLDAMTDDGLSHFLDAYPNERISKEDVFYYMYAVLHSPDYRERFANSLGKVLPRIPRVKMVADFWAFSRLGRELGDLHVGFDAVPEYAATIDGPDKPTKAQLRVEKMRFGKLKGKKGAAAKDRGTVHYNSHITVRDIPLEAYDYQIDSRSPIEWVMDRQRVRTHKASGIVNDANDYAIDTVGDPRYPLSLLLRVVTVSLETQRIVKELPKLDIREDG